MEGLTGQTIIHGLNLFIETFILVLLHPLKLILVKSKGSNDSVLEAIGTLRSEDGDGRENVTEKVNSRSFSLH